MIRADTTFSIVLYRHVIKTFNPLQGCGGLVCMIFPAFHAGLLIFIPFGDFWMDS